MQQDYLRFSYDSGDFSIVNFAVIYLTEIEGSFVEVLRYDGGIDETLHVHKNYCNRKSAKIYLDKELSFDTINDIVLNIQANWFKYLIIFKR